LPPRRRPTASSPSYYAASLFISFLVDLLAMARFARRKCLHKSLVTS
jgi:hypothetical protein